MENLGLENTDLRPETKEAENTRENETLLIVEGICTNGSTFRPSDWSERISSTYAGFGRDHRLHYAKDIQPRIISGRKVLAINSALRLKNPIVFAAVMKFVQENELSITTGNN